MESGLAAILAAEVVGNSRLMELDELGTLDAFKALREKLIDLARISQGRRCIGATNLIKSFCNKDLADSGVATDANRLYLRSSRI